MEVTGKAGDARWHNGRKVFQNQTRPLTPGKKSPASHRRDLLYLFAVQFFGGLDDVSGGVWGLFPVELSGGFFGSAVLWSRRDELRSSAFCRSELVPLMLESPELVLGDAGELDPVLGEPESWFWLR